jgi:hypothetical protein
MKKSTISILLIMVFFPLVSQPNEPSESNLTFGADIVSRYIWRGINLGGPSPHVQPYIEYAAGNSGLAIGFWGSYGLGAGSALTEADLYISYTPVDYLTFTVTDYFFPSDIPFSRDRYFNYKEGETSHTIEGMVSFNGTESFPISVLFAMNLYGADGTDPDGENYFAKYLELGYSTTYRDTGIDVFAGMALDNPDTAQGAEGWYGESAGLINLGITLSKNIRFSEAISVPAFSSLVLNPEAGNIYMVIGLSF